MIEDETASSKEMRVKATDRGVAGLPTLLTSPEPASDATGKSSWPADKPPAVGGSTTSWQGPQPNPPEWGPNVHVFSPDDKDIDQVVAAAYAAHQGAEQFAGSESRCIRSAFLFKTGTYRVDVPVAPYMTVAGLGIVPDEVVFEGGKGVHCPQDDSATAPHWLAVENVASEANHAWDEGEGMLWAVSEATSLRRVSVRNELLMRQTGAASGGFIADSLAAGGVESKGRRAWCARNVDMLRWSGHTPNMVFIGCALAEGGCETVPASSVTAQSAPAIAEKPFLTCFSFDGEDQFFLRVPALHREAAGASWPLSTQSDERVIPFDRVFVARADVDDAESINARLSDPAVEAVVLTPGIYELQQELVVKYADTILLGLGMATLQPQSGRPALRVAGGATGVRVAGLILDAGPRRSPSLLEWGSRGTSARGGLLQDVFCRVGGQHCSNAKVETLVRIKGNHVIVDNLSLRRFADPVRDEARKKPSNPCEVGLQVDGSNVTVYGLTVENVLEDSVRWNGERGSVHFCRCLLPVIENAKSHGFDAVGYRVAETVSVHSASGVGVYRRQEGKMVEVPGAIRCPAHMEGGFEAPTSPGSLGDSSIIQSLQENGFTEVMPDTWQEGLSIDGDDDDALLTAQARCGSAFSCCASPY